MSSAGSFDLWQYGESGGSDESYWQTGAGAHVFVSSQVFGTQFGGDGRSTFGLPDLQGRLAISQGTAIGGLAYSVGDKGGNETVTLSVGSGTLNDRPYELPRTSLPS